MRKATRLLDLGTLEDLGELVDSHDHLDSTADLSSQLMLLEELSVSGMEVGLLSVLGGDPGVVENSLSCETLVGVDSEHSADKALGLVGDVVPIRRGEVVLTLFDLLVQGGGTLVVERGETAQKNVENNSETPYIDFMVIWLSLEHLGGNITGSTTRSTHGSVLLLSVLGETEIGDFDHRVGLVAQVNEVFGLEIAVHNTLGMAVLDGFGHVFNEVSGFGLGITALGHDTVEQLSTR